MAMTVGISALIGVVLGQRFNVLILIPTIILAMVSTAYHRGDAWSGGLVHGINDRFSRDGTSDCLFGWKHCTGGSREPCPTDDKPHQTGFIVDVRRNNSPRQDRSPGEYSSMRGTFLPTTSNLFASSLMAAMQTDGIRAIHGQVRQLRRPIYEASRACRRCAQYRGHTGDT